MPAPGHSRAACGGLISNGSDSVAVRYSTGRERSPGPKGSDCRRHGRAVRGGQGGPALRQPGPGEQPRFRLVAHRQALGDENCAPQSTAERAAYRHLEGTEHWARHAFPDIDVARRVGAAGYERRAVAYSPHVDVPGNLRVRARKVQRGRHRVDR